MLHGKKLLTLGLLTIFGICMVSSALAKVSPEEAARLGKSLTPFGAEMAGNTEGTIPAWEGGISAPPVGVTHNPGDFYQDPFVDDKVLFTITAQNMEQYTDKLSEGQKALLKRYPDTYKLHIYPTRRTESAPQWVYENTRRNATRTSLTEDGLGIVDGYGGIPFPIPKRAEEVVFNHLLSWQGTQKEIDMFGGVIHPKSGFALATGGRTNWLYTYYLETGVPETHDGLLGSMLAVYDKPARRKGELLLIKDPINQSEEGRNAWQYLPGQRRVRRAPTVAYDTPAPGVNGIHTYDDINLFNGAIDRYGWKLIGKKEMFIPYNNYQADLITQDELLTPFHLNPDSIRTELHRVWVVEATLKEGKRHAYAKRVLYIDEDSWILAMTDSYDHRETLWRTALSTSYNHYSLPGIVQRIANYYDFQTESYAAAVLINDLPKAFRVEAKQTYKDKLFTPQSLRRLGRR